MKIVSYLLLLFVLVTSCTQKPEEGITENEILWDTWGVPHIYATNDAALYEMMGWVQMQNHGDLILRLYGESRGKASEYWEGNFEKDYLLHQIGVPETGVKAYTNLSAESKEVINAFVKGLNAYASQHPEKLNSKFKPVLPLQPEDVMKHAYRVCYFEFLINRNLRAGQHWSPGSNAWAVAPSRTANNSSMLLANPHLPWGDFWLFFEAQLITDTNNLYGTTLVGFPTIGIGFNEFLGWTHTVNTLDNVDLYELQTENDHYALDGEQKRFEVDTIQLFKRTGDSLMPVNVVQKRSPFGFVIKENENKALSVKWPYETENADFLTQWKAMGKARSLSEFQEALNQNALPLFNVVYADKEGNILYHFSGKVPKKEGDWSKWQGIVATSSRSDIWKGYYSSAELPSYTNPENGWIQNANDPPFTSTIPPVLDPEKFPSHIAPNSMGFRPQRSATLIKDAKDLTLEAFISLKHDTRSQMALRLQDDFLALLNIAEDSTTRKALKVLSEWDGSFDNESTGAVLFVNLQSYLNTQELYAQKWSFEKPLSTPDGFQDPEKVLSAVKKAAEAQLASIGSLEVPYGNLFRAKIGEKEYPGNGGFGHLGIFRTMNYTRADDGKFYTYHGDGYVCATEFGENITARALLAYGNATQPGNPHVGDQLKLYSEKKLRQVWLTRAEHEENLERAEKIIPAN
ncbi:penicillin acylase family protein [Ascidiimonas aurantiaca]|uniref:penicillin acylase family protein n=1 Tax=Ascidiimonas aurantiaca TaxID=1685432 RepID=UPI0030ECAB21